MTKHQRAYRKALIEKGLPDVYAHMAAEKIKFYPCKPVVGLTLVELITGYFAWSYTPEGRGFWDAICQEAHHVSTN